jgi:hypothetical protein
MSTLWVALGLAFCLVALVVCIILDRRPYRPGKFNFIPIMIVLVIAILVLGRFLLKLTTGIG